MNSKGGRIASPVSTASSRSESVMIPLSRICPTRPKYAPCIAPAIFCSCPGASTIISPRFGTSHGFPEAIASFISSGERNHGPSFDVMMSREGVGVPEQKLKKEKKKLGQRGGGAEQR